MFEIFVSESTLPPNLTQLETELNRALTALAMAVNNPNLIISAFEDMLSNPLVKSILAALLVVAGFKVFAYIVFIFKSNSQ